IRASPLISTLLPYTTLFRSKLFSGRAAPANTNPSAMLHRCFPQSTPESGSGKKRRETMTLKDRHPFAIDQLNQMQRYLGEEMIRSEEHTSELQSSDHIVCRL